MLTIILRVRPQKVCAHPTAHTCVGSLSYTLSPLIGLRKLSKPSSCPRKCHIFKHTALENVSPKWSLLFSPYKYFGCEKSTKLAWVFFFHLEIFCFRVNDLRIPCPGMRSNRLSLQNNGWLKISHSRTPQKNNLRSVMLPLPGRGETSPHSSLRRFGQMHGAGRVLQSRLLPLRLVLTTR